jgi:hypothetical protein
VRRPVVAVAAAAADDPLSRALWIGGGQWAGKSTVARILADRYGITAYHDDSEKPDPEPEWATALPVDLAVRALGTFRDRFGQVLDDLRALVSPHPVLAEGWGLRPELVASVVADVRRMVVMVPTEDFRQRQIRELPRAAKAPRNRLSRDRLVATDAVRAAHQYGMRVIEVDGSADADGVADIVATCFRPYLP